MRIIFVNDNDDNDNNNNKRKGKHKHIDWINLWADNRNKNVWVLSEKSPGDPDEMTNGPTMTMTHHGLFPALQH
jgi:hypothetical protein